jgi:hypothetical protein
LQGAGALGQGTVFLCVVAGKIDVIIALGPAVMGGEAGNDDCADRHAFSGDPVGDAAKALGLAIPQTLSFAADEVIE